MAIANQLSDAVRACAREVESRGLMVERRQGGKWVSVPLDDINEHQPNERTIGWMKHQGLLKNSGSGAGRGLMVDWEVAEAMGLSSDFNDS